jgi:hypothetical protein
MAHRPLSLCLRYLRYRVSTYDTAVFFLQNDAGSVEWPVTQGLREELREAFASGLPTAGMIARRLKSGRGMADEDGGGGVYKGRPGKGAVSSQQTKQAQQGAEAEARSALTPAAQERRRKKNRKQALKKKENARKEKKAAD